MARLLRFKNGGKLITGVCVYVCTYMYICSRTEKCVLTRIMQAALFIAIIAVRIVLSIGVIWYECVYVCMYMYVCSCADTCMYACVYMYVCLYVL